MRPRGSRSCRICDADARRMAGRRNGRIPPMTDMTIAALRTTLLRVPWPDNPWLKGHRFGEARNLLLLEVETKGGIVGMGYLFSFRPGLRTIAAAIDETIASQVVGKDATAVEA